MIYSGEQGRPGLPGFRGPVGPNATGGVPGTRGDPGFLGPKGFQGKKSFFLMIKKRKLNKDRIYFFNLPQHTPEKLLRKFLLGSQTNYIYQA